MRLIILAAHFKPNNGNIFLLPIGIIIVRPFGEKVNSYNNYYQLWVYSWSQVVESPFIIIFRHYAEVAK